MALAALTFLSMVVLAQGRTECDPDLGCFTDEYPYRSLTRPVSMFPQTPESINTRFLLFTEKNIDNYQVVSAKNASSIEQSNFNGSRNSVFVVHGYTESGTDPWPVEMCQTIVRRENVNCMSVDWKGGSSAIYTQAINNAQVVGAEIAYFINTTIKYFNSSLSGTHLIGHSLGGQVVAEAGQRRPRIGRITVLDAAGPGFEGESPKIRIDSSDADFVVALHTNTGPVGLGMKTLIGHKDFFPNGGNLMTGCAGSQILDLGQTKDLVGAAREVALCNHVASHHMFTYSILNPGGLMGYCAGSYSSFQEGGGFPCSGDNCSLMGYDTKPGNKSSCRVYYLNTGPRPDYGRWRYKMTVQTGGNSTIVGSITITMYNSSDSSDQHTIHSGSINGGWSYSKVIDGRFTPPITRVTVTYPKILPILLSPTMWAESVTIMLGNNGTKYNFCSDETTKGNSPQTLTPCP